jgi:RimJ/RimL family protein N-acetyltransferase
MTIARLAPPDAPAYRALMLEAYERFADAFTSTPAERRDLPIAWWEARLVEGPQPDQLVFGAFDGDRLVGAAGLMFSTREKLRHKATLFGMVVRPDWRGRGLARGLVDAALVAARSRPGIAVVQLTVTQGNAAAEALYAHCGFVPFGLEPMAVAVGTGYVSKLHLWCRVGTPERPPP